MLRFNLSMMVQDLKDKDVLERHDVRRNTNSQIGSVFYPKTIRKSAVEAV